MSGGGHLVCVYFRTAVLLIPNSHVTHLRWRVQLLVHGRPRSVALQQAGLPAQTLPLQVDILIRVLLLCEDDVFNINLA